MRTLILALAGAAALSTSAMAAESRNCVPLMSVDETPVINDKTILIEMKGKAGFKRVDLAGVCSGISWEGYAHSSSQNAICQADIIQSLGPTPGNCVITRIVNIDAAEAATLKSQKR